MITITLNDDEQELEEILTTRIREYRKNEKYRWAYTWYYRFLDDMRASSIQDQNTVIVYRKEGGKAACATCNIVHDIFNIRIGTAIAYARLCNEPIPSYI